MDIMKQYKYKFNKIKKLIGGKTPVIIEIGAHYGEDSLRFLQTFKEIRLYCFEPDFRNIKVFRKYVKDDRVKLYEVALSDKSGKAAFFQSFQSYNDERPPQKYDWIHSDDYLSLNLNSSGASSLKRGCDYILEKIIEVQTIRFDHWYYKNKLNEIDFAWIDVQGSEKEVIEGMGSVIGNIKYIWIEYGEVTFEGALNRQETIFLLKSKGFKILEKYSEHSPQGDLLFKREL